MIQNIADSLKDLFDSNKELCIIEVGANIGSLTKELQEAFPKAIIHCFEPTEGLFEQFKIIFRDEKNIHIYPYAMSDVEGKTTLFCNYYPASNSLKELSPNQDNGFAKSIDRKTVICTKLEAFYRGHRLEKIDLLILDVNGSECNIIKGAIPLISQNKIKAICICHVEKNIYKNQDSLKEIQELLSSHAYINYYSTNLKVEKDGSLKKSFSLFIPQETTICV